MKSLPKLSRWFVFIVLVGLVPIAYAILKQLTFLHSKPFNIETVLGHGELLLLGVAVGGHGLGELIGSTKKRAVLKIICGGGCVLTMLMMISWFTDVVSGYEGNLPLDRTVISYGSAILFGLTVLSGGGCIILSEQ